MFVTMKVPEKDYVDCLGSEEYEPQISVLLTLSVNLSDIALG
jgi:hypothetical protein